MKKSFIKIISLLLSAVILITSLSCINLTFAAVSNEIIMLEQPESIEAQIDDKVSFSVKAQGTDLSYEWQHSGNGGQTWNESVFNSKNLSTLSFSVKSYSYNMLYRCVITDAYGNSTISDVCKVTNDNDILKIISQPSDVIADSGDTVSFSLSATGTFIKYRWQISSDNGNSWKTATAFNGTYRTEISLTADEKYFGSLFRCVITDYFDNSITTNAVRLIQDNQEQFTVSTKDSDDSFAGDTGIQLITAEQFKNNVNLVIPEDGTQKSSAEYKCTFNVNTTDLIILKLTAQAKGNCSKINVNINNGKITASYPVYAEKADYYIPITNLSQINSILISIIADNQSICISDFQLVNFTSDNIINHKTGIYLCNAEENVIDENASFGTASNASTADDYYLYSVNKGELKIYDIHNEEPVHISTLTGLGNCYDISLINDGNGLVVTGRESDTYFVDITDVYNPIIASHYATLEFGTGLAVDGSYAFICSRYFGIEIVDASDIYNPKYYAQISNKEEFFDCTVSGNYLFAGSWAQKKIQIYDISDLRNPVFINTITTDGNVGGIVIENDNLYVSTGYHSRDNSTSISSVGFGMGNGLEIYDISNPKNPIWLSTSKIDGRYKYSANDFWKVKVSGNYAILASTYNGIYVYDVSNPAAPIRINKSTVRIEKNSSNYKKLSAANAVFNFDTESFSQAPVLSVCTSHNRFFFGSTSTGIYQMFIDGLESETYSNSKLTGSNRNSVELPELNGYSASLFETESSIYSAKCANNLIYIATSKGIKILDKNLNLLSEYNTKTPVKDILISNDGKYLYTAECNNGLGIYSIDKDTIKSISHCTNNTLFNFTITSITLTADENFILAESGFYRMSTIDIRDKNKPTMISKVVSGSMYYRTICQGLISDKYTAISDSVNVMIYSADESGISNVKTLKNSAITESYGMAAYGNYIVATYNNGYIYFDPITETKALTALTVHKIPGVTQLRGKPVIYGNTMFISHCYGKELTIVDISDLDNPKLISQLKLNASLDVVTATDDLILIPLRNDGLVMLKKNSEVAVNG